MYVSIGAIVILAAAASSDSSRSVFRSVATRPPASVVADSLIERDRLREAAALLDSAIAFAERDGDAERNELADLLELRARILNATGRHNEALPLFERSLAIKIERWGADHPEAAGPALGIASVYNKRGEFAEAARISRRWFAVLEDAYGPAHRETARAAIGLSACLVNLGDYAGAEEVLRRCFDATVAARGERNIQAGELMLRLADALGTRGKHVESTRLFRRAAAIIEEVCGPDHALTAEALSGLAHTLRRIGKQAAAGALYERCIRIIERNHGCPHPYTIHYRCRLGLCLSEAYRCEEGLASIERGIAEACEIYGEDSYQTAIEERHRGFILYGLRRCEEAYTALKRALATLKRYFGADHLYLSKCHKALTMVISRLRRQSEEAYGNICRAVSIHEQMGGKDQLELVTLLRLKSGLEIITGRLDEATASAARATEAGLAVQNESYQVNSTNEAVMLTHASRSSAETCVTAMAANPLATDSMMTRVFSYVLKTHGMVLDRLAERQQFLDSVEENARVDLLWKNLVRATQRTADLVIDGPGDTPAVYREGLTAAYREVEEAERALAEASERLRAMLPALASTDTISTEKLATALDRGVELIHFVRFRKHQGSSHDESWIFQLNYGAFSMKVDGADSWDLEFVDLGPRESIDSLIFSYRRTVCGVEPGRRPSAREENEYRKVARRLYESVWAPLMSRDDTRERREIPADSAATIFLVLESWFHLLDFNTLLAPTGEPVIERYKLHRLSSAGDLLRLSHPTPSGTGLLAVGNPICAARDTTHDGGMSRSGRVFSPTLCPEAYRLPEPLPSAEREVQTIAALFPRFTAEPVAVLLGGAATEGAVKRLLPGNRIAHLATHGFFCEEGKRDGYPSAERLADPLLMSGLVLAPSETDDGLLTAQELMCIDMRGLDWIVLSACGSGLGRLFWGEGLFGLPRAFEMAGTRTVVMTLWKIDDAVMSDIMERMYRYRLAGSSTIDAVRWAQLERFREQRRRLNRIHPALWGGIIAEGDWR